MIIFHYDKTFDGLLCVLFDAFKYKKVPEALLSNTDVAPLFTTDTHYVKTITSNLERVQLALKKS